MGMCKVWQMQVKCSGQMTTCNVVVGDRMWGWGWRRKQMGPKGFPQSLKNSSDLDHLAKVDYSTVSHLRRELTTTKLGGNWGNKGLRSSGYWTVIAQHSRAQTCRQWEVLCHQNIKGYSRVIALNIPSLPMNSPSFTSESLDSSTADTGATRSETWSGRWMFSPRN